ncbi:beta-N-acetylhexosaminidase [Polaribacter pacificus]|uniref:beta-N-acetylhexosaminidase n=1 Tax=Polaribacter pacificus TaxID=1775173 RepID=A0A917I0T3_9FLAO|nr:family 20 glycosylhydrolase [Polaribacter pacificus]GGH00194.1 beta-N-acetylhexosaminidase [Polaribacter pacificus]
MDIKKIIISLLFILTLIQCTQKPTKAVVPNIIPIPNELAISEGEFILSSDTQLIYDNEFESVALFFKDYITQGSSIALQTETAKNSISFIKDTSINNDEGYSLLIRQEKIEIIAATAKGAFYGFQSLRQLLPISLESNKDQPSAIAVQNLQIKDAPQFVYRGMHLDVGRHFFPVDFIKKYIDLMSMLKMNTFHWHLTEDQGWRIEIKKYPKLQEVAAYRDETLIGHYSDQPHKFDGKKYGGFYTQEEVKEIVAYATARQITVIPEIEMPGHAQAALSAYPELSCTGKPIGAATKWGVFDDIYCAKESTFKFLEDVIDEIIPLFPGKYIHIGGDEAPKTRWKTCESCQALIKKEGLKDEHGLQSYFITRMEKYINSKGKQIIGWDEILEGGLAPNATVMSWRGVNGAVEAAKQHHDVILTPGSHCYFDHYQSTNDNEPLAIGGFLPLEKVYSFNPIPEELTEEEAKYVLGAQGNVWTEYITSPEKVEYMAYPRAIALSEVVWSDPKNKSYENFKKRLINYQKRLDVLQVNYANHLYELTGNFITKDQQMTYELKASSDDQYIRYTTDGTEPTLTSQLYTGPITITKNTTIKAASFSDTKKISTVFTESILLHKAVGKSISMSVPPSPSYNAGGTKALINGIVGSDQRYGDKEWLGFSGKDVQITIDLGALTEINSISTRFHNGKGQWIYAPTRVEISFPGQEKSLTKVLPKTDDLLVNFKVDAKITTRYIQLTLINYGVIPDGRQGAGHKAWTFIDEIIVK